MADLINPAVVSTEELPSMLGDDVMKGREDGEDY